MVEWAVMFILAREGQTYARLRFNVGPGGELTIPVTVDYSRAFDGSRWDEWRAEYAANVTGIDPLSARLCARAERMPRADASYGAGPSQIDLEPDVRFVRAEVLGGAARSERQRVSDPCFDPERVKSLDDELDYLRQGYFYEE